MLLINNNDIRDATVNLALEEYCVRNLDMKEDYLLLYINDPAVIIGKHQNTLEEINSDYVKQKNIRVVRRISGGGAVYHDQGNLNFSFMTKHSQHSIHNFKLFTEPVIRFLQELGVNAEINGRNDITVSERKISGNAQFTDTKSMFSHGTLLFDSNINDVVKALNVKMEKIESKGIKSVRSRVANIKEFLTGDLSMADFRSNLLRYIFKDTSLNYYYNLSKEEWKKVYNLSEEKYRSWEWNYGRSPEFNIQKKNRFSFGQIDARVYVREGMIKSIRLYGDFLGHGEISDIENILTGVKFEKNLIRESLENIEIERYFGDINIEDFADFLTR